MQNKNLGAFMGLMIVSLAIGIGGYSAYNSFSGSGSIFLDGLDTGGSFVVQSLDACDTIYSDSDECAAECDKGSCIETDGAYMCDCSGGSADTDVLGGIDTGAIDTDPTPQDMPQDQEDIPTQNTNINTQGQQSNTGTSNTNTPTQLGMKTLADQCDGLGDDVDGDGVCGITDNCIGTYNPNQADSDGDGIGDVCDTPVDPCAGQGGDSDVDGVCDDDDNCDFIQNLNQINSDSDALGDACDICDLYAHDTPTGGPRNINDSCTKESAPNRCGMTNTTTGKILCDSSCSAPTPITPPDSDCPVIPYYEYYCNQDGTWSNGVTSSCTANTYDPTNTYIYDQTGNNSFCSELSNFNPNDDICQGMSTQYYKYDCTRDGTRGTPYVDNSSCTSTSASYNPNAQYYYNQAPSYFCDDSTTVQADDRVCEGVAAIDYVYACTDNTWSRPRQVACPAGGVRYTNQQNVSNGTVLCSSSIINDISNTITCGSVAAPVYYVYTCEDTGDWNMSRNTTAICPYTQTSYNSSSIYTTNEGFCDVSGSINPLQSQCQPPAPVGVPYICDAGSWVANGTSCSPIDYSIYRNYTDGNQVCAGTGTVNDVNCIEPTSVPVGRVHTCEQGSWVDGVIDCVPIDYSLSRRYIDGDQVCAGWGTTDDLNCVKTSTPTPTYYSHVCTDAGKRETQGSCTNLTYDPQSTYTTTTVVCARDSRIDDATCIAPVTSKYDAYVCQDTGWELEKNKVCTTPLYDSNATYYVGAIVCTDASNLINNCQIAPGTGGCGSAHGGVYTETEAELLSPSSLCTGWYTPSPYPLEPLSTSVMWQCEYNGSQSGSTQIVPIYDCKAQIKEINQPPRPTCGTAHEKTFVSLTKDSPNLCVGGDVINFDTNVEHWARGCDVDDDNNPDQLGTCYAYKKESSSTTGGSTGSNTTGSSTGSTSGGSTTGGSSTGTTTGGGGGNNYCGDAKVRYNLGEECDDGNAVNGDGCSINCKLENGIGGSTPNTPIGDMESTLRSALVKLRLSCRYDDVDYRNIRFKDTQRSAQGDPADVLRTYCIVKGYDKYKNTAYSVEAATGIGEFIKIMTKIHALHEDIQFDEYGIYNGEMPYQDVAPDKRYTPYIAYALKAGLLSDIGIQKGPFLLLKPATELPKARLEKMLRNGKISKDYTGWMGIGEYVMRGDIAKIVVDAHASTFADYRYMYGNNIDVYQALLDALSNKTEVEQRLYIQSLIEKRSKMDKNLMGENYNIHIDGVVEFLGKVLRGQLPMTHQSAEPLTGDEVESEFEELKNWLNR